MKFLYLTFSAVLLVAACASPPPCSPSCEDSTCGDDGCGGECGACPAGTVCADRQCTTCGNGTVDSDETCDPTGGTPCPSADDCQPTNACTPSTFVGSPATCTSACVAHAIVDCAPDDGCCPIGCSSVNDPDCVPESCGNGALDDGETCDPPTFPCPAQCQSTDACEVAALVGFDTSCSTFCQRTAVAQCSMTSDGCCPPGCSDASDADCQPARCGDGVVSGAETCDNGLAWPQAGSCPPDCDDNRACTADVGQGAAGTCDVACHGTPTTACVAGDGCCPAGCDPAGDADCALVVCGDGVVDGTESCDPGVPQGEPGSCPRSAADCEDDDPCTGTALVGRADECTARCEISEPSCAAGDGCCPSQCAATNDAECSSLDLCTTYCFEMLTHCTGAYVQFSTIEDCSAACAGMPTGRAGDAAGNSVQCRLHHLFDARTDPESHCAHAGPSPIDGCI